MKKKYYKALENIAKKLPASYEKGKVYTKQEIKDLRGKEAKNSTVFDAPTLMVEREPEYIIVKNVKLYKVNHYRRLKRAYQTHGIPGINNYFRWVDQNNKKLNAEYEMLLATRTVSYITLKSINEFM